MNSDKKWVDAAKKELGGKDPYDALVKVWSEIKILPYYTKDNISFNVETLSQHIGVEGAGPNSWYNLPIVDCLHDNANETAIHHLQNGADGVIFKLQSTDVKRLLQSIKPQFCFLGFEASSNDLIFFEGLTDIVSPDKLNGAIFWNNKIDWLTIANLFKRYNSFRCFGIIERGENVKDQLFNHVEHAIQILDSLTDYAFNAKSIFSRLSFSINASSNFFGDVIKIRALRILLNRVAIGYGIDGAPSFIHVNVNPTIADVYQPHGDLVANSFAAIAGVAASANSITVYSSNQQSNLHTSTARNISLLLKEESRLDKVIDPFAGSYFVESVTNSLVEEVWNKIITKS